MENQITPVTTVRTLIGYTVSLYYKDEPKTLIEGSFIKIGTLDVETATEEEKLEDLDVFFYIEQDTDIAGLLDKDSGEDFVIVSYDPVYETSPLVEGQKWARKCDITGEPMNEGYVFGDGAKYIKHKEDAEKEALKFYPSMEAAYQDDYYYYTDWPEDDYQYIVKDGQLVEIDQAASPDLLKALKEYEGTDFVVNDALIEFVEQRLPKKKTFYYLFGENANISYQRGGVNAVLEDEDYDLGVWTEGDDPKLLLSQMNGSFDYVEITEDEYSKLSEKG